MSNEHSIDNGNGRVANWRSTRRTFLGGIGTTLGLGAAAGYARARRRDDVDIDGSGAIFHVDCDGDGTYRAFDDRSDRVAFETDGTADEAFQYAVDALPETGGTVVASGDTFQFGGPVTLEDDTTLVGQQGTRFVASRTGSREDPVPTDAQSNPLPTGHDLLRVRGDRVTVANVEFDANGTQLDNHAIQADRCTGLTLANNRTINGFQMALSFTRCTNVRIAGNEVVDPNWYGITSRSAPTGEETDLRRSSDVVIAHNRVSGTKFNNVAPYNVSNFAVVGNVVFDGGHSLIACSPAQRGTILGNVCRDLDEFAPDPGGEAGIEIEYKETHVRDEVAGTPDATSYDVTISGNQVDNCPVGVLARTVPADEDDESARETKRPFSFTVSGNSIGDASAAGIRLRSGESGVVATNSLRNCATPIESSDEYTEAVQRGLNATRA